MVIFKTKSQTFLILLCITMSMALDGQNLDDHQWKNRVLLVITNDLESQTYTSQIEEFNNNNQEFKDRKLIIYSVLQNKYRLENSGNPSWIKNSELYITYNTNASNFKIILIGLDGGIKIEQNKLLTTKELFSTIDGMPMRRSELKNRP